MQLSFFNFKNQISPSKSLLSLPAPVWQNCMSFFDTAEVINTQVCTAINLASKREGRIVFQTYQIPFLKTGKTLKFIQNEYQSKASYVTDSGTVFFCNGKGVLGVLNSEGTMSHRLPQIIAGLFDVLQVSSNGNRLLLKTDRYFLLDLKHDAILHIPVENAGKVQMNLEGTVVAARSNDRTQIFIYELVTSQDPKLPMEFKLLQSISREEVGKEANELNFSLSGNGECIAVWCLDKCSIKIWCRKSNESKLDSSSTFSVQDIRDVQLNSTGSRMLISRHKDKESNAVVIGFYQLNGAKYQKLRDIDIEMNPKTHTFFLTGISKDGNFAAVMLRSRIDHTNPFSVFYLKVIDLKSGMQRAEYQTFRQFRMHQELNLRISPSFKFILSLDRDQNREYAIQLQAIPPENYSVGHTVAKVL